MAKKTFQLVAITMAVALVGLLSITVMATGGSPAGDGDEDHGGGGFLSHLHQLGHHLHQRHGSHHHDHMAEMIDRLELTPGQVERLERIHEIVGAYGNEGHGSMQELHNQLVAQVEQGYVDNTEVHRVIDEHLEQIRTMAYSTTDELVALVNDLDANQRETLLTHLQGSHQEHHGH